MPGRQDVLLRGASSVSITPGVVGASSTVAAPAANPAVTVTPGVVSVSTAVGAVTVTAGSGGGSGMPGGDVTHGDQLTPAHVGPWAVEGVAQGSETMTALTGPSRGYWRFDTPDEFSSSAAWPSNYNDDNPSLLNSATPRRGVVTGSPVMIDGYLIPVGTRIVQGYIFPDGYDFYAQGTSLKVLFRKCRFRWTSGVSGASIFNDSGSTSSQSIYLHYCDIGLTSIDPPNGSSGLMHVKHLGGANHRALRNYWTKTACVYQPNDGTATEFVENYCDDLFYPYGELGTSGSGGSSIIHLNGLSVEGGANGLKIRRNRILWKSPDGSTGSTGSAAGQIGYGTQPGQTGYGNGSAPGRKVIQTDCIAIFAITSRNQNVTIEDNYIGGSGVPLYAGNADGNATGIVVNRNKFTTKWWTNSGNFGTVTDQPAWGSGGNVKGTGADANIFADDFGSGGDGTTATADRQYPAGNGPRAGTAVI